MRQRELEKYMYLFYLIQEPQSVVLGEVRKHKGTGAKRTCVSVNEVMMYVPLLSSLEAFLQHEIVMSEVNLRVHNIKH